MRRIKKAPNPARRSGYGGSEVGEALKSIGQAPMGKPTKITLQVIWNDYEADRSNIVEQIRTTGLRFGTAGNDHAFTFDSELDGSKFESLVGQLSNNKACVYRSQ